MVGIRASVETGQIVVEIASEFDTELIMLSFSEIIVEEDNQKLEFSVDRDVANVERASASVDECHRLVVYDDVVGVQSDVRGLFEAFDLNCHLKSKQRNP